MMQANAYQKYQQQSVMTMTQGEMLVRLYEEVVKQLNVAKEAISVNDISTANAALQKSQRIINHLKATLNHQYFISKSLEMLYDFFLQEIVRANIKKNSDIIDDILPLVCELKDTFAQGEKLARMQQ